MLWDLFCRVIDNYGDAGVCWRLARGLAARGEQVRLWLDDASPLRWMAPEGAAGVQVHAWSDAERDAIGHIGGIGRVSHVGDVVVEAFGCDLPPAFVTRMAQRVPRPVWINLEYLSAEDYVERSHGLRSPQFSGPGAGLDKWFFYPGFTQRTGGLLHGAAPRADRRAWLAAQGWAPRDGERVVLLFCYDNPALPRLLQDLATVPTLLLAAPGPAQQSLAWTGPPTLRTIALPWLPQVRFDELLVSTDLNIVRGEDSFAQANLAGSPCIWQLYPQHDGAHGPKLDAWVDRFSDATGFDDGAALRALTRAWNGLGAWPARWPRPDHWALACAEWRDDLLGQGDLLTQLIRFVDARR
ncbi:elongation factor P maturation arginine rhamnosyltransferase EarP [Aquabacterium humicola]|uniref:elongation factor P maturation arginine rhamnosyltransferase EarP n=1 Tax=Aquabacterium humicola TaxID=3237377 RepID=UPI0025434E7F|nr:elongation factor P maturation arginine rhamnosyltransferase EarP [Rubrivivax pictus]